MRQFLRFASIFAAILLASMLLQNNSATTAQDTPTRHYESLDGSFTFNYPETWVINDTISNIDLASHVTVLDQAAADYVPGDVRLQVFPPQFTPPLLAVREEVDAQNAMEIFVNSFNAPITEDGIRLVEASRPTYRVDAAYADFDVMILTVDAGDGGIVLMVAYAGSGQIGSVETDVFDLVASMQYVHPTLNLDTLTPITADTTSGLELLGMWGGHTDWVASLDISDDGTQIVSVDGISSIRVWDIATGRPITVGAFDTPVSAGPIIDPDGQLVLGGTDGLIWVWDAETATKIRDVNTIGVPIWTMQFSPDGSLLAVGGNDMTVHIFDYESGDERASLVGHTDAITDLVFGPDGSFLASSSWDASLRIWNVATGEQTLEVAGPAGGIITLAISPDGQRIAAGGYDSHVYIYDVASGGLLFNLPERASGEPVVSVGFSPDGRLLASGASGQDKTIIIWDTQTGLPLVAASGPGWMNDVLFSPDGKLLFAANDAGVVMVWGVRQ